MAKQYYFQPTKPVEPQVVTAEVVATKRVTPNMQRVTISGPELKHFTYQGYDQWFRLFIGQEGQQTLRLPTKTSNWW